MSKKETRHDNCGSRTSGRQVQKANSMQAGHRRPMLTDIVLGRGGLANHHVGNILYREIVELYQPAYIQAKARKHKIRIKEKVMAELKSQGLRFVQQIHGLWYETSYKQSLKKLAQALREGAPKKRKATTISMESISSTGSDTSGSNESSFPLVEDNELTVPSSIIFNKDAGSSFVNWLFNEPMPLECPHVTDDEDQDNSCDDCTGTSSVSPPTNDVMMVDLEPLPLDSWQSKLPDDDHVDADLLDILMHL